MTRQITETPPVKFARAAGLLYLIIIACGIFSEVVVRSSLIEWDNPAATASNLLASQWLFRIGFAADSIMLLADVAIAVLFYILLKPVNKNLALMAAAFRLTQAAVLGLNLLNYYIPLLLVTGAGYATAFSAEQLNGLVMLYLQMHSHGYDTGLLFFGVSNIFLGYLVIKSGYFPAVLGYGLIAAAIVYLLGSFTRFLFPDFVSMMMPLYIIPLIAELAFALWLLIKGVKN